VVQETGPAVQPVKSSSRIWRILGIIALVLIIGLAVSAGTWLHTYRNLNASIEIKGDQLVVHNNDDYTWFDPYVVLNTDYTFNTSNILPHNSFSVSLTSFRKGSATDFFQASDRPTDLYIYTRISTYQWSSFFYKFQ
jgi:hypothetical protein